MSNITRRTVLKAAPAVALTAAAPALGGEPETKVMCQFRQWKAYIEWTNGPEFADADDDVSERQLEFQHVMEERMFALPSRDARDVLAKFLTLTLDGTVGFDDDGGEFSGPILDEARAFVGTSPFLAMPASERAANETSGPAAALAILAAPESEMHRLIEAHREAHLEHEDAAYGTDEVHLGRESTMEEMERFERASDAAHDAMSALCAYVPEDVREARARVEYLWARLAPYPSDDMENDDVHALLRSMAEGAWS